MKTKYTALVAAFLLLNFTPLAFAAPVNCAASSGLPCVANAGDTLFGGFVVDNSGNDKEDAVESAIQLATGSFVDLILYGKSDDNPELFTFTDLSGPALESSKTGSWEVKDGTLIDYLTVKAANSFVVYFLGGQSIGTFTTEGILNNGGQQPDLSHLSFWVTNGGETVPEPVTLLLMGAGVGSAILRRRRRAIEA